MYEPYSFTTLAGRSPYGSDDGTGSNARFWNPEGLAIGVSGDIYVADTYNNIIRKISSTGAVSTLAGLAESLGYADGFGSAARFSLPYGIAVDREGVVFVADTYNNVIRKITLQGLVTTLAGAAGRRGHNDGVGQGALFNYPIFLALDGAGNIYVADSDNHAIRKVTAIGYVSTLAGLPGTPGSADGAGTTARFKTPYGIAVGKTNNVYVADTENHIIRKITVAGAVTTIAGKAGFPGIADGIGSAARFNNPIGIAVDGAENLYVADTINQTIRKIDPTGSVITLAGAPGLIGSADGFGRAARFYYPSGIAVDSAGNIYDTDEGNQIVRMITPGGQVSKIAGLERAYSGTDGVGGAARFYRPNDLTITHAGDLIVADSANHTIRKISAAGVVSTLAGVTGNSGSADGLGATASFYFPNGVAADKQGNVFVADTGNHTIRKITTGGIVTTIAGLAGEKGERDGMGGSARFNSPYRVAVDFLDQVYVVDTYNFTIRKITKTGEVITFAGSAGSAGSVDGVGIAARFLYPDGIAVDNQGTVYVADRLNHTIRKITASGSVTTMAGVTGDFGSVDGLGKVARFYLPSGLTVDRNNNLYVVDSGNHTIRKITPTGVTTTLAGVADHISYADSKGSADGTGIAARFRSPTGVTVDARGNVYVTDSDNNLIRRGSPSNEVLNNRSRLLNLSVLAPLAAGETLTIGTVLGGAGTGGEKALLARAAGPALAQLGVTGVLPDPIIAIVNTTTNPSVVVATNDDWGGAPRLTNVFAQVGAFAYQSANSRDAAVFRTDLVPGSYTVQVSDVSETAGIAVAELYDATSDITFTNATPRLINLSVLKKLDAAGSLTAGFVVGGNSPKQILIRAVGPGLEQFGVGGVMADPQIELHQNGVAFSLTSNNGWRGAATLSTAFAYAGAFALNAASKDAALFATLSPGSYTVVVNSVGGSAGLVLVEVYEVP